MWNADHSVSVYYASNVLFKNASLNLITTMSRKIQSQRLNDLDRFNMAGWCGTPERMIRPHRHHEIELNFLERGEMTYLFGGREVTISAGSMTLFWAGFPHCLLDVRQDTLCYWITLPLSYLFQWQLPQSLIGPVLNGEIVTDDSSARSTSDPHLFRQWAIDLSTDNSSLTLEQRQIILLEIEARLRRLALSLQNTLHPTPPVMRVDMQMASKPAQMARFISEHYRDPIGVAEIAHSIGLHPNYAMRLFRSTFAVSIHDYLMQHRLFHAQQLLLTTDRTVLDIALESGFGSTSQFYSVFDKWCGQSPSRYRAHLKQR